MNKQSDAKKEQNYREVQNSCANCANYWNSKHILTEEKGKRCTIGGFVVKKRAMCDRHVFVKPNVELTGTP